MIGWTRRARQMGVVACTGALALAACGGGGGGSKSSGNPAASLSLPSFSIPSGSTAGNSNPDEPKGPPTGKIRIANFFAPGGQPGPALDFYDMSHPSATDKPLIANLAYGDVSDYITPRSPDTGDFPSNLYIFPAGSQKWGTPFIGMQSGSNISNAGWSTGQQRTVVMGTNAQGISGQANPTFQEIVEEKVGPDEAPMLITAPSGKSAIVVNTEGYPPGAGPNPALRIDGKCPSNIDPQTNQPVDAGKTSSPAVLGNGSTEDFLVTAGSHLLEVPLSPGAGQGLTLAQCEAKKAAATKTIDAPDGAKVEVFLYGPSFTDLRLASSPVG